MAKPLVSVSVQAPGFYGINSQASSATLPPEFATVATNAVIDKNGRIGSRRGYSMVTTSAPALGSNYLKGIFEFVKNDGTTVFLSNGNLKVYSGTTTLTDITPGAYTVNADNWQYASLNNKAFLFQRGQEPLCYWDNAGYTLTAISGVTGYLGTPPQANCVLSAYGRLWAADTSTDKQTVSWSDLLSGHIWSGGSSGNVNIANVLPNGTDEIVALAAHNGFLIIFCKKNIVIYSGATSPASMTLQDVIVGIGCIARDSVQNTGNDILFLSDSGLRSFQRVIQEKSMPMRDLSKNVRDELLAYIESENTSDIKSVFYEPDAFYLLSMPSVDLVYCFDMRSALEDGSARVTTWNTQTHAAFLATRSRLLYLGQLGGIAEYGTYLDNAATYRLSYYTPWLDFGEPTTTKLLKKTNFVVVGGAGQGYFVKYAFDYLGDYQTRTGTLRNGGAAEYGIGEYGIAEYSTGAVTDNTHVQAGGSGRVLQVGFETDINGSLVSVQKIDIFCKTGRVI